MYRLTHNSFYGFTFEQINNLFKLLSYRYLIFPYTITFFILQIYIFI